MSVKLRTRGRLCALPGAALAVVVTLAGCTSLDTERASTVPLTHAVGMYGVGRADEAAAAQSVGASLVLLPTSTAPAAYVDQLRHLGMGIVDSSIKNFIYSEQCPSGIDSCHALAPFESVALSGSIRSHVERARTAPVVSAYYLLDDRYTDMRAALRLAAQIIHSADPGKPTVCGFNLPLVSEGGDTASALQVFTRALQNYSPQWCDRVAIYAYARPTSAVGVPIDWSMASVLPAAITALKNLGWDPVSSPLIGVPQAFGTDQNTGIGRPTPDTSDLRTQVRAFCRNGAQTILAYIWNSRSADPNAEELHNTPQLRSGLVQGISDCRTTFWR